MTAPLLKSISIYPIKSLRGHDVSLSAVEFMGLKDDRRFMLVDTEGMFLTQREYARMALIIPEILDDRLKLSAPGMQDLALEIRKSGRHISTEIWNSQGVDSIDQGDEASEWFSSYLKVSTRLVRIDDQYQRRVDSKYAVTPEDRVGFADGYPMLIVSQESLDDLNDRLAEPIPMNRFRPNLVISGVAPFAEDSWKRIRIGKVEMALVKPCARCNIPTINQETAESAKEPNTTLATFRKRDGKVFFGVNVIPLNNGSLDVGDRLDILE